jgi:ectoine hydroxylase-related dioxygenase (phytanoyl-CoA dioxygenase family)
MASNPRNPMTRQTSIEEGFRIYHPVLEPEECSEILAAIADAPRSRAGSRHLLWHPAVSALAHDSRLVSIARDFLATTPFPYRATLFEKSPRSNWLVVWHQDTALPFKSRVVAEGWGPWSVKEGVLYAHAPAFALSRIIALRIHLDPSEHSNGPLHIVPGSHRLGVLTDDAIAGTV